MDPQLTVQVNQLFDAGRPMVVASGSPRDRVLVCLESCGMGDCFKVRALRRQRSHACHPSFGTELLADPSNTPLPFIIRPTQRTDR